MINPSLTLRFTGVPFLWYNQTKNSAIVMKLSGKEMLAWMALLLSILFFSATVALAQDSKAHKRHINLVKTVNGKTISIDTTFTATDEEAEKIMADIQRRFDSADKAADRKTVKKKMKVKDAEKDKVVVISVPHMSESEHQRLKQDIERALDEMENSFDQIGKTFENFDFNFNFNTDDDSVNIVLNVPQVKIRRHRLPVPHDLPDSVATEDRVIIEAEEGEDPPVFEKSVKGESGQTYFIYKRKNAPSQNKPVLEMDVFPNPNNGKFSVKFNNPEKSDVMVKVFNESGKEVYRQLLESVKGEQRVEIELGTKSKGNYLVSVTAGTRQITKKVVIQ